MHRFSIKALISLWARCTNEAGEAPNLAPAPADGEAYGLKPGVQTHLSWRIERASSFDGM